MSTLIAFAVGLVFGVGLIAAGMTNPAKVQGFLDLLGPWDPSLSFVMGGAIAVATPAFWWAERRKVSWSGLPLELPLKTGLNPRLVVGGVLFGMGWGLGGYCPGPALVALGSLSQDAFYFVPAMLAGMWAADSWSARQS